MKLIWSLLVAVILASNAGGVQAASTTEQICTTDSYGNRNCSNSTSTTTTQEVTYTNTNTEVEILNTSLPGPVQAIAAGIVILGGLSVVLRKRLLK